MSENFLVDAIDYNENSKYGRINYTYFLATYLNYKFKVFFGKFKSSLF